uniref:Uncharacterized protein n=1 Tax=Oryza meridionalis TaxID=40149 RepID=A0A0E0C5M3_9ORYZ
MATLRRRIREAREAEEEEGYGGGGLPAEWMELERRHHGSYVAGVRGAVGLLQAVLVSTRPGLALLLLLGVPASDLRAPRVRAAARCRVRGAFQYMIASRD